MDLTKKNVEALASAKKQVSDGSFAMWNLRLDLLLRGGHVQSAIDLMSASVEDTINNCGCNVQCGALGEQFATDITTGVQRG